MDLNAIGLPAVIAAVVVIVVLGAVAVAVWEAANRSG
jgi:hypothetical protein